jgi:hypothetical protein
VLPPFDLQSFRTRRPAAAQLPAHALRRAGGRLRRLGEHIYLARDRALTDAVAALIADGWRELEPHGDEVARLAALDGTGKLSLISVFSDGRLVAGGPRPTAALRALAQIARVLG